MKYGLYEKVFDKLMEEKLLGKEFKKIRNVDGQEVSKVLSVAYQKLIQEALLDLKDEQARLDFLKRLNKTLGFAGFVGSTDKFQELLTYHGEEEEFKRLNESRPRISIAMSSLFTGNSELSLESELKREIQTADEICFLISFIKYSGLRLIYDELLEFTKNKKLRVITTSYMGASDYKAILTLAELPNTEVKISFDTKRTRLHAKAYYFKRYTGFSTAYIGSSNLSNPALSNGLEWNLKISEYTSKDVLDGLCKTFETYWHDEEFRYFSATNEISRKELKESLSNVEKEKDPFVFFDLYPYPHQKVILDDLRVEREEYDSRRNLVVAATGERVIIVTGCNNALVSRVSGTFN